MGSRCGEGGKDEEEGEVGLEGEGVVRMWIPRCVSESSEAVCPGVVSPMLLCPDQVWQLFQDMNIVLPPKVLNYLKHKSWIQQDHHRTTKTLSYGTIGNNPWIQQHIKILGFVSLISASLFLSSPCLFPNLCSQSSNKTTLKNLPQNHCLNRYIYIQDLPTRFNEDVLKDCESITRPNDVTSMCVNLVNNGFGPLIRNPDGVSSKGSWFATNQFMLEVIFHERMKRYECLTNDSSLASAVYVPFYAGLDLRRYLWRPDTVLRDSSAVALLDFLSKKPEWKGMLGGDHFLVTGRISREFRRNSDNSSSWGSKFMMMSRSKNLLFLTIESSLSDDNQFAIPYPTYFHPRSEIEVSQWQERMRRAKRSVLFSFAGAPRPKHGKDSLRSKAIEQCNGSSNCKFLDCQDSISKGCNDPLNLMKLFKSSLFCLQPPGDSFTRRSIFDSILAGCVPVFFHPGSAYHQYLWHLPKNHTKYSVYIEGNTLRDRKTGIEQTLLAISEERIAEMREEVISMIPRIVYSHPSRYESESVFEDAFDIAVKKLLERMQQRRIETRWQFKSEFTMLP